MTGLIIKLIVYPAVVYLSSTLLDQLFYTGLYQPILTGLISAIAVHIIEVLLLKPQTNWYITALDFITITAIIYLSAFVFPGAVLTLTGASITGFVLALTEIPQHFWLITTGKTLKSPRQPAE